MNAGELWDWAKRHPGLASVLGLGLVVLVYLLFFRRSAAANGGGVSDLQAYYAAEMAQASSNAQIQGQTVAAQVASQQINATADVQKAAIAANENAVNNQTAAALNLGIANSNAALQAVALKASSTDFANVADIYKTALVTGTGTWGGAFYSPVGQESQYLPTLTLSPLNQLPAAAA